MNTIMNSTRKPNKILLLFSCFISLSLASINGVVDHTNRPATHAYVAVCILAKNEHLYIREFIKYHLWIGIDKFYVWDHQSQPPLAYVLEDYVLSNVAEVFYFSDSWRADAKLFGGMYNTSTRSFLSPQAWAYDNCYRMFSHRHTFIALMDPDEFIILKEPPQPPSTRPHLPTFLQPFEAYGGVAINWQLFGPSGHVARPNDSTLASYTQCVPRHVLQTWREFNANPLGYTKSITSTRCYQRGCNPHVCELKPGCKYVNENFMDLSSSILKAVHWDRIAVFHYVTRSIADYSRKLRRGSGHSQYLHSNRAALGRSNRGWRYFALVNASATATCSEGRDAWQRCCAAQATAGTAAAAAQAQLHGAAAGGL